MEGMPFPDRCLWVAFIVLFHIYVIGGFAMCVFYRADCVSNTPGKERAK